jgi:hypothetical protein
MGGLDNKWALEEHVSTGEANRYWDTAAESARNGKALTEYVEYSLLDVDERVRLMDKTGIERAIVSLTSPGIQSHHRHRHSDPLGARDKRPRP